MKASKITTVDFFDDLASPYARKRFFWGFVFFAALCIAVIVLVRTYLPEGGFREVIDALATNILASVLIILGFYVLYMHFIGPNAGSREVIATRPRDIRERIEALPVGTRYYAFWGRSGSYFRSAPLLKLDEQARKDKLITDVDVVLPDPMDARLIKSYREILLSLGENPEGNPLLANVLATSMACAIISANNKYIRIRVFYSKFLPAFRVDMSENGAILTQDDPGKSALFFEAKSEFHEMFRTTVRNEMAVSTEVKWDESLFEGLGLVEKSCDKQTLNAFGIKLDDVDNLQQEVATMITKRPHRYK
ncbi:hypothetical protein LB577_09755 [Mesorhizobium sp. B283B1A]|uniref:hypothetical protein n=1 Tax=Mesorhizobium TaxID=68287 RepID=UPI001CD09B3B|nr:MULTISPECIES: hypothetical protein [Mesorhizobium]MCA0047241.1 hypothetical protein [Mesorhizobium sp. B283B1A]UQS66204.1 hypothetical protein M5D98_07545 [Mesorhizobium opportunistum]